MPKILYIVHNEKAKNKILQLVEEHRKHYSQTHPTWEYAAIEVIVQTDYKLIIPKGLNADVIVARGILATNLMKAIPCVPVVRTPVTTSDILLAVQQLEKNGPTHGKLALLGLGLVQHQIQTAEKMCDKEMVLIDCLYQPLTDEPITELFDYAVKNGFSNFLGGASVVRLAKSAGLRASFVYSSSEATWTALTQAQNIAELQRQSRERSVRFETIFNHSGDGIIALDIDNRVVQINPHAARILKIKKSSALGSKADELISDLRFQSLINDGRNHSNIIIATENTHIILSKEITSLGNETIGCILTFQEISRIQSKEIKIRKELHLRVHQAKHTFDDIIGDSASLSDTLERAKSFAMAPSSILIFGETGTGKELFAQGIHNASPRKDAPFVAVNCAAIPDNLIESEFFGYSGGAFTGASKEGKRGLFEIAHNGTIFLDEISEIPLNLQGKLLRVIQEGEIMRLGDDKVIPINTRILCATNQNLWNLVQLKKFRADLFFRLAVLQLQIPPLRKRLADIGLLADHFVDLLCTSRKLRKTHLTAQAKTILEQHSWVGNVRELSNICEQLVVLNRTGTIDVKDVSSALSFRYESYTSEVIATEKAAITDTTETSYSLTDNKRQIIIEALKENKFHKTKTAQSLGINRSTLWRLMKEYNIDPQTML